MKTIHAPVEQDLTLYAEVAGEGPPVVLLHGLWFPQLGGLDEILVREGFQAVVIHLPGHGQSGMKKDYDLEGLARWVLQVTSHLGLETSKLNLVGVSLGGHVALQLALRFPGVNSLALIGVSPLAEPQAAFAERIGLAARTWNLWKVGEPYRRSWVKREALPFFFASPEENLVEMEDFLTEDLGSAERCRALYRAGFVMFTREMISPEDLEGVVAPAFVGRGVEDRLCSREEAEVLFHVLPGCYDLAEWGGLGHLAHLEDPEAVAQDLIQFLKDVTKV